IEQKQRQAVQRLGLGSALETAAGITLASESADDFLQHTFAGEHRVRRYQFTSGTAPTALQVGMEKHADWAQRLSWSAALLGAVGMLVLAGRRGVLDDWSRHWPHVLGVMAGVAWWLWLAPSVFGWVLIVGSLLASLRPAWRTARESPSAVKPRST